MKKFDPVDLVKQFPQAFWVSTRTYGNSRFGSGICNAARKFPEVKEFVDKWCSIEYYQKDSYAQSLGLEVWHVEERIGNVWNRLRRKALKDAGLKNSNTLNKRTNKKEEIHAQRDVCLRKVTEMVNELLLFKAALEGDGVTVKRIRNVYDMTCELNSANKKYREVAGLRRKKS